MSIKDIYSLLEGQLDPSTFLIKFEREFNDYKQKSERRGTSISILLDEEFPFTFSEKHLIALGNLYLKGKLSELHVNYIVDSLIFADSVFFSNERIFELLESFTDPSVNGELTKEWVESCIREMHQQ